MKPTVLVIIGVLFFSATSIFAQKAISEATLSYNIAINDAAGKTTASATNASLTVYIKGANSRADMTSNLGSEKTIYDAKAGTAVILKEYSGQKLMITLNSDNWKEKNKRAEAVVFADQAEKKTILNYQCTKAVAKLNDGSTITVFYTKDILIENKEYDPLFNNLSGLPLQYEVTSGKLKFTYTMSKVDLNNVAQAKFEIPKAGYRVISYDENKLGAKK